MRPFRSLCLMFILILVPAAGRVAWALQPDQIVLVVNANVPESRQLAEFYAQERNVPPDHIVALDVPNIDEIPFDVYERQIVAPLLRYLHERDLRQRVTCLVTFYGIPLRHAARQLSADQRREAADLSAQLSRTLAQIQPLVVQAEQLAGELDPAFRPFTGATLADLARRADLALQAVGRQLPAIADPARRAQALSRTLGLLQALGGNASLAQNFGAKAVADRSAPPQEIAHWQALIAQVRQARSQVAQVADQPFDFNARARHRALVQAAFGLIDYAHLLEMQSGYLQTDATVAAIDSELALLWSGCYPLAHWQSNPLYVGPLRDALPPSSQLPPTLMVMRLDGPDAPTVRRMIQDSVQAEHDGIAGQIVIDTRGLKDDASAQPAGYAAFDQVLRDLADIVRAHTRLKLMFDQSPDVIPAHSASHVALYCGWYSVRHYVPGCSFDRGAVGYHVASYELRTLHQQVGSGWVRGLLSDGVVATLGPVAEPYLVAFPRPDDFFALLLTGKLTLAEVYWRTTPMTSWMMCMIGDPLYTPYKLHPALSVNDLPPRLQSLFAPPIAGHDTPTSQP